MAAGGAGCDPAPSAPLVNGRTSRAAVRGHPRCAPALPQRSKTFGIHPLRTGQCGCGYWRGTAIGRNQIRLQLQPQRVDLRRPPVVQRQDQIIHLLAGGGTAARPAIGQRLLHHVDVLPHRVGQLRLLLRAPSIGGGGRRLRCGGHLAQRRWQRRLQIPAMRAKADSAAANDAMRRQAIRCWQSRSGLNEVSVITTPVTRATGRVQSSCSGQAPLEHAPIRPCRGAEGRGRAYPFLHCTDPRQPMPLPSSRPG